LDYASGSVVQLNDLRNNFERFYDQILKDATERMPSLIKEFHEDLVNNKKRGRKSTTKVPVDFKGEMKMLLDETVEVYMNEISERFEAKNLQPLISIYNMINDDHISTFCSQ